MNIKHLNALIERKLYASNNFSRGVSGPGKNWADV